MNVIQRLNLLMILCFIMPLSYAQTATNPKSPQTHFSVAIFENDVIGEEQFKIIEEKLGYTFTLTYYRNFPDIINSVITGSKDLTPSMIYNPQRATLFQVSSPTNLLYIYIYSKSLPLEQIKTIATARQAHFIPAFKATFPEINIEYYTSMEDGLRWVEEGRVDALIDTIVKLDRFLEADMSPIFLNELIPLEPAGLAASFNIPNEVLEEMAEVLQTSESQQRIRQAITEHHEKNYRTYIQNKLDSINYDRSKAFKVAVYDFPMFVSYKTDPPSGIVAEVLQSACQIMDIRCEIELIDKNATKKQILQRLKDGEVDAVAPLVITPERQEEFYFTSPFYSYKSVVVKRIGYESDHYRRVSDLFIERIGIISGSYHQEVINNILPNKELVEYKDIDTMVNGLLNEDVDYILISKINFNALMKASKNNLPLEVDMNIQPPTGRKNLGFAFAQSAENKQFIKAFNQALKIIDLNALQNKYRASPNWTLIIQSRKKTAGLLTLLFSLFVVVICIFIYIQYKRSMTDELTKLKNRRAIYSKYPQGIDTGNILVYLDINAFKHLNDTFGHKVGDQALLCLTEQINTYWHGDAYRIGGDEFVLISKKDNPKNEKFCEAINPFVCLIEKENVPLYTSYGYFEPEERTSIEDALHAADLMMYKNKSQYYAENGKKIDRRS